MLWPFEQRRRARVPPSAPQGSVSGRSTAKRGRRPFLARSYDYDRHLERHLDWWVRSGGGSPAGWPQNVRLTPITITITYVHVGFPSVPSAAKKFYERARFWHGFSGKLAPVGLPGSKIGKIEDAEASSDRFFVCGHLSVSCPVDLASLGGAGGLINNTYIHPSGRTACLLTWCLSHT